MALTTRTLPSLMNGVSRQPAILRSPDQTADELNTWGRIATGLSRRPPTVHLDKLDSLDLGDASVHHINRDINERYTVIIDEGSIKVYDQTTGAEETVTAPLGWGYLDAPGDKYRAVTMADYTFIVNTEKTVELKGLGEDEVTPDVDLYWPGATSPAGEHSSFIEALIFKARKKQYDANPPGPGVVAGTVKSKDDLPDPVCVSCIYRVKGDAETSFVSYYVMGDGQVWNETVKPGLKNSIDELTMPHALVRKEDGTFEFAPFSWAARRVGDLTTNPYPPFVGRTIRDVFFYQNRLGFVSDESTTLSVAGDFGDFFRRTILDYIDSDPISAAMTTSDVAILDYAVPFSDGIMVFSRQRQFSITNGESGLSAHSIAIQPVTAYTMSPDVRPSPIGSQVHFATDSAGYSAVQEYTRLSGADPTEAADITAHVFGFIPKGVSQIISAPEFDAIFVLTRNAENPDDRRFVFVYQFFWDGDKKIQSAWRKWDLGDGLPVSGAYTGGVLTLVVERPDGYFLEKIELSPEATSENQDHLIYLDRQVTLTGTYDSGTNLTTFTLPYVPDADAIVRAVRTSGASIPESLVNPASVTLVGSEVRITGDESAEPVTLGQTYETMFALSQQFPTDWQGRAMTTGRLQIHNMTLNAVETVHAIARVYPYGRVVAEANPDLMHEATLSGRILGTPGATLGRPSYYNGAFTFSVSSDAAQVWVEVTNDSPFSSTFTSAEWEGLFHHRAL